MFMLAMDALVNLGGAQVCGVPGPQLEGAIVFIAKDIYQKQNPEDNRIQAVDVPLHENIANTEFVQQTVN